MSSHLVVQLNLGCACLNCAAPLDPVQVCSTQLT